MFRDELLIALKLVQSGRKRGKHWGFEVRVPHGVNCTEASPDVKRPLADWLELGLIPASGAAISKDMLHSNSIPDALASAAKQLRDYG